jgi:hypothetical protein
MALVAPGFTAHNNVQAERRDHHYLISHFKINRAKRVALGRVYA